MCLYSVCILYSRLRPITCFLCLKTEHAPDLCDVSTYGLSQALLGIAGHYGSQPTAVWTAMTMYSEVNRIMKMFDS